MSLKRPQKINKPHLVARKLLLSGRYLVSEHAYTRMYQRSITDLDIFSVIQNGSHLPKRDEFSKDKGWSYCMEGLDKTKERKLRIAIAINSSMIIKCQGCRR